MATEDEKPITEKRKLPLEDVGAALTSILSGNPYSRDEVYHAVRSFIENGRYSKNLQAFSLTVDKFGEPYETTLIQSSHGAYLFFKTMAPQRNPDKTYDMVPAYTVMFSQYPDMLKDIFTRPKKDGVQYTRDQIEENVKVVASHYERDILQGKTKDSERIITSWVLTAVRDHSHKFDQLLKRHGSVIQDGDRMWRSGSSIFWIDESRHEPGKYNCHYYSNPIYGQISLFLSERALKNRVTRGLMGLCSIRLNEEPIPFEDMEDFVSKSYNRIARSIISNIDPYDEMASASMDAGSKVAFGMRFAKKMAVRTVQKMAHAIRNLNPKTLTVTLAATGVLFFATSSGALLAATGRQTTASYIIKGGKSVARGFSKLASPVKTLAVNALNDISPLIASHRKNNIIRDDHGGLMFNYDYLEHLTPVPKEFTTNTFPDIVNYDDKHSDDWARGVLLDTLGIQPGTIYSVVQVDGTEYLKARQPNGLDVYYDPEEVVAFAHYARGAENGCALERPIERLFNAIPDEDFVIGVKQEEGGKISHTSFPDMGDVPPDFVTARSKSIKDVRENIVDIDVVGAHKDVSLLRVIPEKEARAVTKRARKEFNKLMKSAFKDEARIARQIDLYCFNQESRACGSDSKVISLDAAPQPPETPNVLHVEKHPAAKPAVPVFTNV